MKQLIQSFKTGQTILEDIPAPQISKGCVLIQTNHSLVSLGTERMLVEFGKSNLISKARQQPDKVKQVLEKFKTDGILPTLEAVFNKLEQPLPLGYCNVGTVIGVGDGVSEFRIGDRVASNGNHAEIVNVPQNLVAKIPDNVSDIEASFTVIASIGLQGIRLANPTLGETTIVIGLGLIGLLTAQILKMNGCQVIGIDFDENKLSLAREFGIITCNPKLTDTAKFVENYTNGIGADVVLITASSKSNDIISSAAKMSRKRGKIILVGVVGLNLSRADFYEKELVFQVSCSYGPGRYDENYEQKGIDYPISYVRWTERRNFEAVLQCISSGQLKVKDLVTEVVSLNDYAKIYDNIGSSNSIASILSYSKDIDSKLNDTVCLRGNNFKGQRAVIGVIGSGNFTKMTMLPALKGTDAKFKFISSKGGVTSTSLAKKYGFSHSTTSYEKILQDPEVDLVMITTRHDLHSRMVIEALNCNKNVFVEKPLALNIIELEEIIDALKYTSCAIHVGYNRRFSPHAIKIKQNLSTAPMNIVATMNAGFIPSNVWVHDLKVGGGRIIGEACHYIDLCSFFTGSKIISVCMSSMGSNPQENTDNASILLKYADGSNAVINYFSNGSKEYSKERFEIYQHEKTFVLDNFCKTSAFGVERFSGIKTSLDKGHKKQFELLIESVKNEGMSLIPIESIVNTSYASFAAIRSLKERKWIDL